MPGRGHTVDAIGGMRSGFGAGRHAVVLFHGTDDEILPPETSAVVQMLAGHGEIVLFPGTVTCSAKRQRSSASGSTNGSRRPREEASSVPVSFTSCR